MCAVAVCFEPPSSASRWNRSWSRLRARRTSGLMANTAALWRVLASQKQQGPRGPYAWASGDVEAGARACAGAPGAAEQGGGGRGRGQPPATGEGPQGGGGDPKREPREDALD